jgi:hypothetical protein
MGKTRLMVGVLLIAAGCTVAAAADLTGTWQVIGPANISGGAVGCSFFGSTGSGRGHDAMYSQLLITQIGSTIYVEIAPVFPLLHNRFAGTVHQNSDNPDNSRAVATACDLTQYRHGAMYLSGTVNASRQIMTFRLYGALSPVGAGLPDVIAKCFGRFRRVSAADPNVAPCP